LYLQSNSVRFLVDEWTTKSNRQAR
jgi:hypothetical protein